MKHKLLAVGAKAKVTNKHGSASLDTGTIVEIVESDRRGRGGSYDYTVKVVTPAPEGSDKSGQSDILNHEDIEPVIVESEVEEVAPVEPTPAPVVAPAPVSIDPRVNYLNKIEYGKSYFIREIIEHSVEVVKIGGEIYKREADGTYTPFFGKLDLNYAPLDSSEIPF